MRIHGIVLIAGANREGIGLELTRSLLENPNVLRVYAGSRNAAHVEDLQKLPDLKEKLRLIQLDISKDWSIKDAYEAIRRESGKLNVLINNSAILETDGIAGIPHGERIAWLRHMDVNTVSHAVLIQEMLPLLENAQTEGENTTIVNVSALNGSIENFAGSFSAIHGNLSFMCSKAAINMLTKQLSLLYPKILTVSICATSTMTTMEELKRSIMTSETAHTLLRSIDKMTLEHTGLFWNKYGERIPF